MELRVLYGHLDVETVVLPVAGQAVRSVMLGENVVEFEQVEGEIQIEASNPYRAGQAVGCQVCRVHREVKSPRCGTTPAGEHASGLSEHQFRSVRRQLGPIARNPHAASSKQQKGPTP